MAIRRRAPSASHHRWWRAVACIAALFACDAPDPSPGATLLDDFGRPIAFAQAEPPTRIVSLNPTTTELLFAIGAGDRLVGRSQWDVWPDSARLVPSLGDALRPSVEAILAARPDLVLLYASADNRPAADRLEAAGIATIGLKIDRIEHFARATRLLGRLTNDSARAETVVDTVLATLERVRSRTAGLAKPRVFWHIWDSPLITIGRASFLNELIEIAGATNIYADFGEVSPAISLEDVARRDPDFILAGPDGAATIRHGAAWQAVPAVAEGRVLVVDTLLVARPSVKLGEAAVSLARLLHPEIVW